MGVFWSSDVVFMRIQGMSFRDWIKELDCGGTGCCFKCLLIVSAVFEVPCCG
jgi:hypothetical protein